MKRRHRPIAPDPNLAQSESTSLQTVNKQQRRSIWLSLSQIVQVTTVGASSSTVWDISANPAAGSS